MKLLFYVSCFILQIIYLGMVKYRNVPLVQAVLGPMDIFLALAMPIGFSQSIISFRIDGSSTYKKGFYPLGFLLLFTVSQIMHCTVGSITSDALAMTEGPPIEEKIAQLLDKALHAPDVDERTRAASLLYLVSGVKTMYQVDDNQYKVFTPSNNDREERQKWIQSNRQVAVMKHEIFKQLIAINHHSIFHMASFFLLFTTSFLLGIRGVSRP